MPCQCGQHAQILELQHVAAQAKLSQHTILYMSITMCSLPRLVILLPGKISKFSEIRWIPKHALTGTGSEAQQTTGH